MLAQRQLKAVGVVGLAITWSRCVIRSAVLAPRTDLGAAGQRGPGRLGPVDGGVGAGRSQKLGLEKRKLLCYTFSR
jgi:hypothetical protein